MKRMPSYSWPLLALIAALLPAVSLAAESLTGPEALIVKLYKDYAWEAVIDEPVDSDAGLLQQPVNILNRYFDPHMVSLILRDRVCEEKNGICRLDYDPIWDSQDPGGAMGMKIQQMADPSEVSVDFIYAGHAAHMHIVYVLSQTRDGWRISDIQGTTPSLRKLLEADFHP
ncbi:hypothetical protein ACFFJT_07130 [Dyella flava]|uniref:DUF3828 domain-containing protein n=1 Tax=Dyella flava TaxID=1920170 RepID=A0ABS2K9A7_9GAMM|nr:hypothetical protein [Dyella flava]MBM7127362.1 hypothetical protein [Dyella flava]GLQ50959.1 hypothetical protein GCM10010872_24080 [Dyella flava]